MKAKKLYPVESWRKNYKVNVDEKMVEVYVDGDVERLGYDEESETDSYKESVFVWTPEKKDARLHACANDGPKDAIVELMHAEFKDACNFVEALGGVEVEQCV